MSVSAHLVCPARRLSVMLGKRLTDGTRTVTGFALGPVLAPDDPELTAVIWKFLADTAGEELVVKFSDDLEFEEFASYREIGGWAEDGDIPADVYLRDGA
jgi:hypothetical protein